MASSWQMQEAKNRLSHVVHRAVEHGAQIITVRGKEVAVVLSVEEYRHLTRPNTNLVEFLESSPLRDSGLELDDRSRDTGREIEL